MANTARDERKRLARKWPQELRDEAREQFKAGGRIAEIAKGLAVPQRTVDHWLADLKPTPVPEPPGAKPAALRRAGRPRDGVKHLRVLVRDGLELAEFLAVELRRELVNTRRTAAARERSARLFAVLTTNARQLARVAIDLDQITRERALEKRATSDEQDPARSLADIREEFARRLQAIYGGRDAAGVPE